MSSYDDETPMTWSFVSFIGDSTVILPSVAITLVILLLGKTTRSLAVQWGIMFGLTGLLVTFSKLAFMGWGIGIAYLNFTGFSGHSALSAVFWPIFLWLLARSRAPKFCAIAAIIGLLMAATIGYSRVIIHAHSTSEVIAGLALGIMASGMFFILQVAYPRVYLLRPSFISVAIIPVLMLNTGIKAPTQSLLGQLAVQLGPLDRIYTRDDMLASYREGSCRLLRCEKL